MVINLLPRKRKKKNWRFFLLLIILAVGLWGYYLYSVTVPVTDDATIQTFIVEPGWGTKRISQELHAAGLIRNAYFFQFYVLRQGIGGRLQEGEFFLAKNQSLKEIAQALYRGAGSTKEQTLTFIEGWTTHDIASYLEERGIIGSSQEFFDVIQKKAPWWDGYEVLESKPHNFDLEGYLFPDTYRVFRDATAADIVQKMLDNLEAKLTPELRSDIDRQGRTIHEILTVASILEKEVAHEDDFYLVADIFYKRLKAGVALQADSTVNYATGKSVPRVSSQDLQVDSLYNTYRYKGLPPGPIASPSLAAIIAAVYPTINLYWYFLTTPTGEVIYSQTFEEHVREKAKYYR